MQFRSPGDARRGSPFRAVSITQDITIEGAMPNYPGISLLLVFAAFGPTAVAHDNKDGPAVVPEAERQAVAEKKMQGPAKNKGIRPITQLGTVGLGDDFPALQGRQLRAREIVVEPGGVVAVHEHQQRPGVAYILEGHIYEHRRGEPKPVLKGPGAVAFEKGGIVHWWENRSKKIVRALVVDIVPEETKK